MTPSARLQSAIEILDAIEAGSASRLPADAVVAHYLKSRRYIGSGDRRAIAEQVYGILRKKARLEWHLAHIGIDRPTARWRVLADQAICFNRAPEDIKAQPGDSYGLDWLNDKEKRAMERLRGQKLFHHDMPDWVRGEYPAWIEEELRGAFGESLALEMAVARDEAPFDLRINTLKCTREQAIQRLAQEGINATPTPLSPLGLRMSQRVALKALGIYRDGWVDVQDEGSQLVALLVDAKPGEAVVDFCSGAGGKSLALAAAMQNKGRLVACDINEVRMNRGQDRFRRAGVHNVTRRVLESESDKWVKRAAGSFDAVLVDAPCTGTGTWRRNPDAKWSLTRQDLDELSTLQGKILSSAARLTKIGGRLVYATCSILPQENEERVAAFLADHPDFTLLPVAEAWRQSFDTLCPVTGDYLRLSPAAHHTDGFFAAILLRRS